MLIALATLVVSLTAVVALVGAASGTRLSRATTQALHVCDDLLIAAQQPIVHWLENESASVTLPPDTASPEVAVMHDLWLANEIEHELRITAWDQCGMVPAIAARAGSPLRLSIPEPALQVLDARTDPEGSHILGLDTYAATSELLEHRIFPQAGQSTISQFSSDSMESAFLQRDPPRPDQRRPEFGALIATHAQQDSFSININTAPMPLVRAALREAGRGGMEHITASRAENRHINIGSLPELQSPRGRSLNLISSSHQWSFRIDIRVGEVKRSWWCVYLRSPASEDGWECVQRLVIRH